VQVFTQRVEQGGARIERELPVLAVDLESHRHKRRGLVLHRRRAGGDRGAGAKHGRAGQNAAA